MTNNIGNLGRMLRQQRLMRSLTLRELSALSGISPSHLGRIEKGGRFPSAAVLRRLARPLAIEESELFLLAGYLSPPSAGIEEKKPGYSGGQLDPYVREVLSQEPVEVQRAVIGILSILKIIAQGVK
ncbi:MAG: helix-turn-helix transcriptional regulator [Chloroflexi bacterium]|nr:helix-turn-helix transcriptional regulator [Chloroflexota bacterium]MBI2979272.1 helix-turn-helix transcriptional regulator [Chloroflexota bacterium]